MSGDAITVLLNLLLLAFLVIGAWAMGAGEE